MSDESYAELQEAVAARTAQLRAHQDKRVGKVEKANAKSLAKEVEAASELDDKDRSGLTQGPGEDVAGESKDIEPVGAEVIVGSAANQAENEKVTAITNSAVKDDEKVEERKLETPEKDEKPVAKKATTSKAKKAADEDEEKDA